VDSWSDFRERTQENTPAGKPAGETGISGGSESSPHRELAPLAAAMGRLWKKLGDNRIGHGDMKASNFLIDDRGEVWLIDLDGVRFSLPPGLYERQRRQDRWCLLRNFDESPAVRQLFESALGLE
jgi:hypothetical protein